MSRGSGYITVECDGKDCHEEIDCELTSLASGGWDERNIDTRLARYGWTKDGDKDLCEECSSVDEE